MNRRILVTGGCGFVGSNFILSWLAADRAEVVNLDCLSYAANPLNLSSLAGNPRLHFVKGNVSETELVRSLLFQFGPEAVIHFAAETHVDRSLRSPEDFVQTNVIGTCHLLQASRAYWQQLSQPDQKRFRFIHISTDEVYGSLGPDDPPYAETSPYSPNSPYAASKAGSDHLVRAYHRSYGLPTIIINSTNIYGPRQFPEKLIPLMIINCIKRDPLPVYGDGMHRRAWLYVEDFCQAIMAVLSQGKAGEKYHAGGSDDKTNLEVVGEICNIFDQLNPASHCRAKITFVNDRPGHDRRYILDCSKIQGATGWAPSESFTSGLRKAVEWYLQNPDWIKSVTNGTFQSWVRTQYGVLSGVEPRGE